MTNMNGKFIFDEYVLEEYPNMRSILRALPLIATPDVVLNLSEGEEARKRKKKLQFLKKEKNFFSIYKKRFKKNYGTFFVLRFPLRSYVLF